MSYPVLILAGPTGVGKSALAQRLAEEWNAEIVSADARQVYRELDVGTAKPSKADRARVPHHLIDTCSPGERYSAAQFVRDARAALTDIAGRGRRSIVVGGTGLYLKALREGLFEAPEISPETRDRAEQLLERHGKEGLKSYLSSHDPETLAAIDDENTARLRRAVEFHLQTDESLELVRRESVSKETAGAFYPVVLVRPRAQLYDIIELRTDTMLRAGWLEEVEDLARRWTFDEPAFDAVGYRELYRVGREEITLSDARQSIIARTRRYAKRQLTWFSHQGTWVWMSPEKEVTAKITSGLVHFAENKSA
jgi:tRNA dimethylallyltransferase